MRQEIDPANPTVVSVCNGTPVAGTGLPKFVDKLPGLGPAGANGLVTPAGDPAGQYIPVAVADTITYPGSDYYEIALVEYTEKMHSNLPPTKLRGYVQLNYGTDATGKNTIAPAAYPHYLGPTILSQKDRRCASCFATNYRWGRAVTCLFQSIPPSWVLA